MDRRGKLLALALVVLGWRGAGAPRVVRANSTDTAIRHDDPGELPTVGDQGFSMSCVPWATRTIAAHHYRRLASPWRLVRLRVPSWPWWDRSNSRVFTFRIFVGRPNLDGASNRPSVTYVNNLALRRTLEVNHELQPGESFEEHVQDVRDPLVFGLNVGPVVTTLSEFGAPSEFDAPFTARVDVRPTPLQLARAASLRCRWAQGLGTRREQYAPSHDDLVAALASGPALLMMRVHDDFDCSVGEEYVPGPHDASTYRGRHAIVAVAFDPGYTGPLGTHPATPSFRLMNSWGTFWGANGYVWVSSDNLLGGADPDRSLVDELHRFDVPAGAACPDPAGEAFPAGWTGGGDVPWTADPARTSCEEGAPPLCGPAPTPTTYARRESRALTVERVAGARVRIRAPAIPLVPALLHSTVKYWVDGAPAGTVDPAKTGFAFHFVDRDGDAVAFPRRRPADGVRVPAPAPRKAPPDSGIGADPSAIGAFVDRAILEVVDPGHPTLAGGRTVRILVEVYDPGTLVPRAVARYRVRIGK